jgi:membrane-associated protein
VRDGGSVGIRSRLYQGGGEDAPGCWTELLRAAPSLERPALDSGSVPHAALLLASSPLSPDHLINTYGVAGLLLIIFAECGLLIGFFLPGDTLLFAAGLLLATGKIHTPLAAVVIGVPLAAIAGNIAGYWIGYTAGPRVFDRPGSRFFRPEFVDRANAFFERWGASAVILARFVPVIRTVATVVAGVSRMAFVRYLIYSIIGGVLWSDGVVLVGYWLGHIRFVRDRVEPLIDPVIIGVVLLSLIPVAIHAIRARRDQSTAPEPPQ